MPNYKNNSVIHPNPLNQSSYILSYYFCFIYPFRFGSFMLFTVYTIRIRVVTTRVRRSGSYGGLLQKGP